MFLIKANNVRSERTFFIQIEIIDGSATRSATRQLQDGANADYFVPELNPTSRRITLEFPPHLQRIPFNFTLFPDESPENEENFQVRILSGVDIASNLHRQITIRILDNDRKSEAV